MLGCKKSSGFVGLAPFPGFELLWAQRVPLAPVGAFCGSGFGWVFLGLGGDEINGFGLRVF